MDWGATNLSRWTAQSAFECYSFPMAPASVVRALAAAFAICFASANVLPSFEEPCPVHDPAFATLSSAHANMSTHSVHQAGAQDAKGSTHGHQGHHCKCVGCSN